MNKPDVWYHDALFYALTTVDIAVLLVIGISWSACLWVAVEGVKGRLALQKPYTRTERAWLAWLPVAFSAAFCALFMPYILDGLGQPVDYAPDTLAIGGMVGIIGGLGSKGAHDAAGGLMRAALDRVTNIIGGK